MKDKRCFRCDTVKPLVEFYKHSEMADGHLNKCKDCTRKDTAARYVKISNDPGMLAKEQARQRGKTVGYRLGKPEIVKAHQAVKVALLTGKLKKMPCEVCGALRVDAHHEDYDKPLDVRWLCRRHHLDRHMEMKQEAEAKELAEVAA